MIHPDTRMMLARDIQRDRQRRAERHRLTRTARGARRQSPTRSARTQRVDSWSGQLEPC